jgi:hypothetical protein
VPVDALRTRRCIDLPAAVGMHQPSRGLAAVEHIVDHRLHLRGRVAAPATHVEYLRGPV